MNTLKSSTAAFAGNLVRPTSMIITSGAVLACTFLPVIGGAPKLYEMREFAAGVGALMNGETSTPSLRRVVHPDWGGVQAQTIAAVDSGVRMTAAALVPEAAAAEVEELAGDNQQAEIVPLAQTSEPPADVLVADDDVGAVAAEVEDMIETPELEAVEEIAPLDTGD